MAEPIVQMTAARYLDSRPPYVCDHTYAEKTSRYDLRCVHCGQSALVSEQQDDIMLDRWIEWARKEHHKGATRFFERIQFRLGKKPSPASPSEPLSVPGPAGDAD